MLYYTSFTFTCKPAVTVMMYCCCLLVVFAVAFSCCESYVLNTYKFMALCPQTPNEDGNNAYQVEGGNHFCCMANKGHRIAKDCSSNDPTSTETVECEQGRYAWQTHAHRKCAVWDCLSPKKKTFSSNKNFIVTKPGTLTSNEECECANGYQLDDEGQFALCNKDSSFQTGTPTITSNLKFPVTSTLQPPKPQSISTGEMIGIIFASLVLVGVFGLAVKCRRKIGNKFGCCCLAVTDQSNVEKAMQMNGTDRANEPLISGTANGSNNAKVAEPNTSRENVQGNLGQESPSPAIHNTCHTIEDSVAETPLNAQSESQPNNCQAMSNSTQNNTHSSKNEDIWKEIKLNKAALNAVHGDLHRLVEIFEIPAYVWVDIQRDHNNSEERYFKLIEQIKQKHGSKLTPDNFLKRLKDYNFNQLYIDEVLRVINSENRNNVDVM